jgi:hypothetical protein
MASTDESTSTAGAEPAPKPTQPARTTTTSSAPASPATTSPAPATTVETASQDFAAAQDAIVRDIKENSVSATFLETGSLNASGAILDQFEAGSATDLPIDVRVLVDLDGTIWFAVLGELGLSGNTSIEFDAVEANGFTVVAETSALGLDAGPTWVQEAPTGSVIQLSLPEFPEGPQAFRGRTPSPAGAGPSGQLGLAGYLLTSDIATDLANFGKPHRSSCHERVEYFCLALHRFRCEAGERERTGT